MRIYDDYDRYDNESGFKKFNNKKSKKVKYKGHHSRRDSSERDYWCEAVASKDFEEVYVAPAAPHSTTPKPAPAPTIPTASTPTPATKQFVPGPNTHNIKNNFIDFDRLAAMEKVEGEYNGRLTFGIKFTFTGKKALSRTAWFSSNKQSRDQTFADELAFWKTLPTCPLNR